MFRRALFPVIAIVVAAGLAATPASAQRGRDRGLENPFQRGDNFSQWDQPRQERAPQREINSGQAKDEVIRRYGAKTRFNSSRIEGNYFVFEITTPPPDGKMITVRVNATTGRLE